MKKTLTICEELESFKNRDCPSPLPIIGIIPDWHITPSQTHSSKPEPLTRYINLIKSCNAKPYIINYDDYKLLPEIVKKLDGLILPGGRDIPPCFYNQSNNGSYLNKESKIRFFFYKAIMQLIDQKMPVFGICYGFQFLNVFFGGSMIQHLEDKTKIHYKVNKMVFEKNSWFGKLFGNQVFGSCAHHQNIDRVGNLLKVVAFDEEDHTPHALELDDPERFVKAILWHPERIHEKGNSEKFYLPPTEENLNIVKAFVEVCDSYKKSKNENL